MSKGPRFKQGFTWRHHFDEWWDRRPQELKAKFFVTLVLGFWITILGLLAFLHRWTERNEILKEAKQIHQNRIEASDKLIAPKFDPKNVPALRNGDGPQTRPGQ